MKFLDRRTRSQLTGSHLARFAENLPRIYVLYLAKNKGVGGLTTDTFSSDKVQSIPNGIFLYSPQNGRTPSPTPPPPLPEHNVNTVG